MATPRVSQIRKYLKELDAESLMSEIERILERFPEAKKFYLADLSGDTKAIVKTARTQIERCFKGTTGKWKKPRSSKLNAIIRDFERVSVFREDVLELQLYRLEKTVEFFNGSDFSTDALETSTKRAFDALCMLMKDLQLVEKYQPKIEEILAHCSYYTMQKELQWALGIQLGQWDPKAL